MTACASGCTSRGRHLDDCPDQGQCGGCLPVQADEPAILCVRCVTGTRLSLTRIPDLVAHIRTMIEPGAAPESSGAKHTKAAAPPAPLNVAALTDADDLHAAVAEQVERVMEGRGLRGPDLVGCDIRPAAKRRNAFGDLVYEPARIVGVRAPHASAVLVGWLLPHLPWLMAQEGAEDVAADLQRLERAATSRWPAQERPRALPMRCPACDRLTLTRYAPSDAEMPVTITCASPDCRHVVPEDEFTRRAVVLEAENRTARRSA